MISQRDLYGKSVTTRVYRDHEDEAILSQIGDETSIVDVGCGEGTLALACAGRNNDVIGIDISSVAVELAQSRKEDLPARFQVGDARDLPFSDNSFVAFRIVAS